MLCYSFAVLHLRTVFITLSLQGKDYAATEVVLAIIAVSNFLYIRKHLVQSRFVTRVVPTITLAECRFGLKIFCVRRFEWDTLCPHMIPLPQLSHRIAIDKFSSC